MDDAERDLLAETLRKTMTESSGQALAEALTGLGWPDLLADVPDATLPLVFRLLGETGAQAPLLNDVLLAAAGQPVGGTLPLPYAGGRWVVWERTDEPSGTLDELPLRLVPEETAVLVAAGPLAAGPLAAGRRALGWWLVGTGRAMLAMARTHALDRVQFGQHLACFQAVRHKLADTLVALEGAEAALQAAAGGQATADPRTAADTQTAADGQAAADDLCSVLAKAAAGQAALTAARHCQQILGGLGFTAEYGLHRHVRRALVLDGLLGSARELTRVAGERIRCEASAPRLVQL